MMNNISNDYTIDINSIKELNEQLILLQNNSKCLDDNCLFLDIKQTMTLTGWSKKTVETLFNHPMFPCTNLGKKKLVLKSAFVKFFMDRRCKGDELHWKYSSNINK